MTIFGDPEDQRWCDNSMSIYNNTILFGSFAGWAGYSSEAAHEKRTKTRCA